jgi:Leucine-rich repeat (LRR) protein
MHELPQPNARSIANLDKIAAKIGEQQAASHKSQAASQKLQTAKKLQQIPIEKIMEWAFRYGYSSDEAGDVTGLNMSEAEIADISFLKNFPRLTHLNLYNNQVADISPLQALTQLTFLDLGGNYVADLSPLMPLIQNMEIKWEYKYGEKGIFLLGNPLEILPPEIVKKGKKALTNTSKKCTKK